MLLEKGHKSDLLPCAGITLIRFYGYNLRSTKQVAKLNTPGNAEKLAFRESACPSSGDEGHRKMSSNQCHK